MKRPYSLLPWGLILLFVVLLTARAWLGHSQPARVLSSQPVPSPIQRKVEADYVSAPSVSSAVVRPTLAKPAPSIQAERSNQVVTLPPTQGVPAVREGQVWSLEIVDDALGARFYTSLALDSKGYPHISYQNRLNFDLEYAYYDGSDWHVEVVDSEGKVGAFSSLALDAEDRPHISYDDSTGSNLKYAYHNGSTWITEIVSHNAGGVSSLVLDAAGHPHIAYSGLRYAYHDGSSWQNESVDPSGSSPSMAFDAAGRPHILYFIYSYGCALLKYAHHDGASWHIETVTLVGDGSADLSLALDEYDHLHASYGNGGAGTCDLVYAHYDGQEWSFEVVDSEGFVTGNDTSLALDSKGYPHISYHSVDEYRLKYAYYDGQEWQVEVVEPGTSTSLALDAADRPHISYFYDGVYQALKYAHLVECVPLQDVAIAGPGRLPAGIEGLYRASYTPVSATLPVLAWDNGTAGSPASYSWPEVGSYTLTVTATSPCGGAISATMAVSVFCQPLEGLSVLGPPSLLVGQAGLYQAVPQPLTASLPLSFSWSSGAVGASASYSWTVGGRYTLSVSATNLCGGIHQAAYTVRVLEEWPYGIQLPLCHKPPTGAIASP